ncbi:hypothetical protein D3C74_432790 [compost metagenome]
MSTPLSRMQLANLRDRSSRSASVISSYDFPSFAWLFSPVPPPALATSGAPSGAHAESVTDRSATTNATDAALRRERALLRPVVGARVWWMVMVRPHVVVGPRGRTASGTGCTNSSAGGP